MNNITREAAPTFEPAAYDWITYEKRDKEDTE